MSGFLSGSHNYGNSELHNSDHSGLAKYERTVIAKSNHLKMKVSAILGIIALAAVLIALYFTSLQFICCHACFCFVFFPKCNLPYNVCAK